MILGGNLFWGKGNSVLGMQFRTCENFRTSTDLSLVESPKISTNTKATPQFLEFASEAKQPSLPLRFCESQNLGENSPIHCHSEQSAESSKNISSLRADSQNLHCKPPIKKTQNIQGGLPREQSSLAMTENKDFAESALDSASHAQIAESKIIKSLGAIGKIFLEEASTLNELNDKLNHIFAPKDLKNFEFGENARILKGEILRLLAESGAESNIESGAESGTKPSPLDDFESLKSALSKNAPFKGKAFFMPLRFLLTGAQKGPHLDTLYPHLRPFLTQILKD